MSSAGRERAENGESPEGRIEALERENAALRRVNAKLMRERIGSSNTAAAGRLVGRSAGGAPRAALRAPLARARLAGRRLVLRLLR